MIVYEELWKTMQRKNVTQYRLINEYGFSAGQLSRLRANMPVSSHTIDVLCTILDCRVEEIMTYVK